MFQLGMMNLYMNVNAPPHHNHTFVGREKIRLQKHVYPLDNFGPLTAVWIGQELVCLSSDTLKLQCPITMERVQAPGKMGKWEGGELRLKKCWF